MKRCNTQFQYKSWNGWDLHPYSDVNQCSRADIAWQL